MSKNSSFFKNAEKQDEKRQEKISETKKKVDQYLASKVSSAGVLSTTATTKGKDNITKMVDTCVSEYESRRDVSSIKVVVDMDMFYAAVAIRDRPHLKDKPVAIGGNCFTLLNNQLYNIYSLLK
jgi:DNA polymerase kappa